VLLLPAVMRYNAPVAAGRLEVVAQVMAPSATGAGTGACAGLGGPGGRRGRELPPPSGDTPPGRKEQR
jgi:hypothetical protein